MNVIQQTFEENTIRFRASLGRWRKDDKWYLFKLRDNCPTNDLRAYTVVHCRGRFRAPERYNVSEKELMVVMNGIYQTGYIQSERTYPELNVFFNDRGELLTDAVIFRDEWNNIKIDPNQASDGLEMLFESFQ